MLRIVTSGLMEGVTNVGTNLTSQTNNASQGVSEQSAWDSLASDDRRRDSFNDLLAACEVVLRMMETLDLDESQDGEAEVLRDAIRRANGWPDELDNVMAEIDSQAAIRKARGERA